MAALAITQFPFWSRILVTLRTSLPPSTIQPQQSIKHKSKCQQSKQSPLVVTKHPTYNYWNSHTSQWIKFEVPPVYRPKQASQPQNSQLGEQSFLPNQLVKSNLESQLYKQRSPPNQQAISILKREQLAISVSAISPISSKTSKLKSMLNIAGFFFLS